MPWKTPITTGITAANVMPPAARPAGRRAAARSVVAHSRSFTDSSRKPRSARAGASPTGRTSGRFPPADAAGWSTRARRSARRSPRTLRAAPGGWRRRVVERVARSRPRASRRRCAPSGRGRARAGERRPDEIDRSCQPESSRVPIVTPYSCSHTVALRRVPLAQHVEHLPRHRSLLAWPNGSGPASGTAAKRTSLDLARRIRADLSASSSATVYVVCRARRRERRRACVELARLEELLRDVRAADQLALDEHLRDRRPARERRELLADARVGEDVHRRDRGARRRARRLSARYELPHMTICGVPFMKRATGSSWMTSSICSFEVFMSFLSS